MDLEIGQKVAIIIGTETTLGFTVLIEESMEGLVYKNEVFSDLEEGVSTTGYIKNIREDGKIDVSMRPLGYRNTIEMCITQIYQWLKKKRPECQKKEDWIAEFPVLCLTLRSFK